MTERFEIHGFGITPTKNKKAGGVPPAKPKTPAKKPPTPMPFLNFGSYVAPKKKEADKPVVDDPRLPMYAKQTTGGWKNVDKWTIQPG